MVALMTAEAATIDLALRALADGNRRAILRVIRRKKICMKSQIVRSTAKSNWEMRQSNFPASNKKSVRSAHTRTHS